MLCSITVLLLPLEVESLSFHPLKLALATQHISKRAPGRRPTESAFAGEVCSVCWEGWMGRGPGSLRLQDEQPCCEPSQRLSVLTCEFFFLFYLLIHERHRQREAETQAEGEAGSMQGARCGTQSWVSRITPWAESGVKLLSHPGCPPLLLYILYICSHCDLLVVQVNVISDFLSPPPPPNEFSHYLS